MNHDELFLHTLDDLEEHTAPGASEYQVLMSSGRLRKLLLDGGQSLVDQVNRPRQSALEFSINEPGEYENMILSDGPVFWALTDGLDPETALVIGSLVTVGRDRFLARRMVVNRGTEYSVADVIRTTANVIGGVHVGKAKDERSRVLAEIDSQLQIGGVSAAVRALPPIARVTRRGLDPLRTQVREDLGLLPSP
jgi:hypothetical protein